MRRVLSKEGTVIHDRVDYSDKELNLLKTILAKGMESVAQVVSDMIGQKINMSVPEVSLMSYDELARICTCDIDEPSIGVQVKMSGNIEGYVALFFPPASAYCVIDLLLGNERGTSSHLTDMGGSALCEIGNLAGAFFLNYLADATSLRAMPSPPVLNGSAVVIQELQSFFGGSDQSGCNKAFVAQTVLSYSAESVDTLFFILPTHESLATILGALKKSGKESDGGT
jgi:chemotaxis protein CheY-P-specific phosphatase CheC